ncbi:flavin reductase [Pseudonocardia sp. EC080610-09]|uniref:flavin reductase family protein n=1 Tax=unclassified Pseudonocardia TaxID=2619320 RepID=UPI0006CB71D7|nr:MULTISPECIES: flavin reductase family protein [unclassified Pseudonocardia]ALE76429.1 flavin reductase [Pseudonocardia sp. EC080625-04]ALL79107.1 flavin reductase [Pseudonocardia sp. EC080610-09]ALL84282.1 flavin reductase [Pseudonocardia sp. EC080619-01]
MTVVAPGALTPEQTYKLLCGIVVPRPIAWITTASPTGTVNLAPFSCFTFVSNAPPMVGINIGRKSGRRKDTGHNIHETGEFVVHIPDESMIEPVHLSAVEHPPGDSEVELLGLETVASQHVGVPRLAAPAVALECRLHSSTAYGSTGAEFVVGEVLAFHVRDGLLEDNKIDTQALAPIARVGGPVYAGLGEMTRMTPIAQTPKTVLTTEGPR